MHFPAGLSKFQVLSLVFVLFFLLGLLNIHFSDREDQCLMTYMFEYPQFVRIPVPENDVHPQYGLYAYSEGRLTEKARKMWFDGVPVLFLPGNSGSHKQGRSLASVALQKAMNKGYEYHFDYFTISYNEELSGLYGGVLEHQTEFAAACISKILSLYKSNKYRKSVPTSIILIGHSMGGVIAKRLLAYPPTLTTTSIAITLASPLEAPPVTTDLSMDKFYSSIDMEWSLNVRPDHMRDKVLLSFGGGIRDTLVASGLTSSNDSFLNALTTSVPGVWVSPDHISMVWCKQLVLAINRYLFAIVDPATEQISENIQLLRSKALWYFQANRSMTLNPNINRAVRPMLADAFWYEDNRRIYQITRPEIQKTTYLMIRLTSFPQNRFVAIESVNVDDKDWIYGCNAKYTHSTYRYCKEATSLTELSRWSAVANPQTGRRKLATVQLHQIMEDQPDWSHVLVKVSPTRKPITLNVDINDLNSRQLHVNLPYLSFGKSIIKQETDPNSVYYEIILADFNTVHEAYLLYVEPSASCKVSQYHVTAELHVPWAKNHEYFHHFTPLKRAPMKIILFKTNPNITYGLPSSDHAKVILLLDPQCTFTISISSSWYHRLAQFARNYSTTLIPYMAAIILLAVRSNLLNFAKNGACVSIHTALSGDGVQPYYVLVFARLVVVLMTSIPFLTLLCENASWPNIEVRYFVSSLLVIPSYMVALGLVNVMAAVLLGIMLFWSQIAHRLMFRIIWRGGPSVAEKVAQGLQAVPALVSATLLCACQLACGSAALAGGAAFYAFMLSNMYEGYLQDYFYKLLAKVTARIWKFISSKLRKKSRTDVPAIEAKPDTKNEKQDLKFIENTENKKDDEITNESTKLNENGGSDTSKIEDLDIIDNTKQTNENTSERNENTENATTRENTAINKDMVEIDEDLSNLNFHMMMFLLWVAVTLVNLPPLFIWAKNFKYSMVLKPDTSYPAGLVLSACSSIIWQMTGPRPNLKYYDLTAFTFFVMAVVILVLGPFTLVVVDYGLTLMFLLITLQQLCDKEDNRQEEISNTPNDSTKAEENGSSEKSSKENVSSEKNNEENVSSGNRNTYSENQNTSSENRNTSSENRNTSSENRNTSSENHNTSRENQNTSSENQNTFSENRNASSERTEPNASHSKNKTKLDETPKDTSERIQRKYSFIADDFGAI